MLPDGTFHFVMCDNLYTATIAKQVSVCILLYSTDDLHVTLIHESLPLTMKRMSVSLIPKPVSDCSHGDKMTGHSRDPRKKLPITACCSLDCGEIQV